MTRRQFARAIPGVGAGIAFIRVGDGKTSCAMLLEHRCPYCKSDMAHGHALLSCDYKEDRWHAYIECRTTARKLLKSYRYSTMAQRDVGRRLREIEAIIARRPS